MGYAVLEKDNQSHSGVTQYQPKVDYLAITMCFFLSLEVDKTTSDI